jgi:predicted phage terminase large subunit-like protein
VGPDLCARLLPEPYILLLSDTNDQAHKYLESIKLELESNALLARDYPAACGRGPVWREDRIRLRNGVVIEALGTGAKIRGRKNRSDRPTLVIGDDLQNNEHITSPVQRERTWEWLSREVLEVGTPATNYLTLGTALHRECIVMRLLKTPGWRSQVFRSIISWPDRMDLWARWETLLRDWDRPEEEREESAAAFHQEHQTEMEKGEQVLWPEREPLLELMRKRASIGPAAFASEKQSDPVAPGTQEWPDAWLDRAGFRFHDWPERFAATAMGLDPSKGRSSKSGDYSAFVWGGVTEDGHLWLDADLDRRPSPKIVEDGLAIFRRFPVMAIAGEANQFQELLLVEFERVARERRITLPLYAITNTAHKDVRIRTLGPYLSRGEIHVKASPGGDLLVQQMREFPGGEHDDAPDAAEMMLRMLLWLLGERNGPGQPQVLRAQ